MDFTDFYKKYQKLIYNRCNRYLKNSEEAKDLMQDIFLEILIKPEKIKYPSTYLYTMIKHKSLTRLSKRKCENIDDVDLNNFIYNQESLNLENFYNNINEENKTLLNLSDTYTYKEISKMLNVSESAIKMKISRLKKQILNENSNQML